MSTTTALQDLTQEVIWLHGIVLLRVGPMVAMLPGLGERTVPVRIRLVAALLFTAVVAPAVAPRLPPMGELAPPAPWLMVTETGIGVLIGLGLRLFVLALQTAGAIAGQSTSLAQVLGNAGVTPLPAIGHLLMIGGLALVMISGLHAQAAQLMVRTYDLLPLAQVPDAGAVAEWGTRQVAGAFALAFTLVAPFVIVSVLYNLTLGVINRAMPQLMVVFVGAPVITGAGLVLLLMLAPTMLTIWVQAIEAFLSDPLGAG